MTSEGNNSGELPAYVVRYVEDVTRGLRHAPAVALQVRKELLAHFEDALEGLEEPSRGARALELIREFGDAGVISALINDAKRKQCKEEIMKISVLVGIGLLSLVLAYMAQFASIGAFVDLRAAFFVVVIAAGMGVLSFGVRDYLHSLCATRVILSRVPAEALSRRDAEVLRAVIPHLYVGGVIAFIIGLVFMLWRLEDPARIGEGLAVAILSMLYATILSEVVVRPALRNIDRILADTPRDAKAA